MKKWFSKHKRALAIIAALFVFIGLVVLAPRILSAIRESRIAYAQPVGKLVIDDQQSLQDLAIATFSEKHYQGLGQTQSAQCSGRVFGYDEKYIYGFTTCKWFGEGGRELGAGSDYGRYAYKGQYYDPTVTNLEIQGEDNKPSLESLYPAAIYHIAMPNVVH